jgi:uncharacterized protein (TIGR03118 family)
MRGRWQRWWRTSNIKQSERRSKHLAALERLEDRTLFDAAGFVQTNLVSDLPGFAPHTDRDLINPWGFTENAQGQFRLSANGAGNAPIFDARGAELKPEVALPPPPAAPPGTVTTPNGQLLNNTADFVISAGGRSAPASNIFSTEDGTIVAWSPQVNRTHAVVAADESSSGAVYKLLAMDSTSQGNFLYATDFHNNKIDVFDKNFNKVPLGQNGFDTFTDPNEPAGFAPFGIKNVNGTLLVSYAKQLGPDNHDDQEGPGNGFIDEFSSTGTFIARFASGTAAGGTLTELNSPIGMAIAPAGFGPHGEFGGALLVGNFGSSQVSAFNLQTGQFLGQLSDAHGNPLVLNGGFSETDAKGLWGIAFGNGHGGADPNTLFFAAGINQENDGLFGKVSLADDDDHGHKHGDNGGDNGGGNHGGGNHGGGNHGGGNHGGGGGDHGRDDSQLALAAALATNQSGNHSLTAGQLALVLGGASDSGISATAGGSAIGLSRTGLKALDALFGHLGRGH